MTTYSIDLCTNWAKVGEAISGTFDGVVRDLAPGEWTLTGRTAAIDLEAGADLTTVDTVRVVDGNGVVIFGGYVAPATSGGVSGLTRDRSGLAETFTLRGPDLWGLLASRVAYPTPSTAPPWADAYDQRSGVASTVAAGYLRDNLGSGALAARQVPLTIVDGVTGMVGYWSARLQPLPQLIDKVCTNGGITCRLAVTAAGVVAVTLGPVRDRTATCVLSDQGDLTSIHTVISPAVATFVVSGGQGSLAARTFVSAGTATGTARREAFSDQSVLATVAELQQSSDATLQASAASTLIDAVVTDEASQRFTYLRDYDIGDIVSAQIGGASYPVPVSTVTIHVAPDRTVVRPTLGTAVANDVKKLLLDVANLQSRFATQIA